MEALILSPAEKTAHLKTVPIPSPAPNELLVKVQYIALNPVDALYTFNPLGQPGRVVGSDFSGEVVALGSEIPSHSQDEEGRVKIGRKVAGFLQGACSVNDRPGAFAEFVVVPWDLCWVVDDEMGMDEAAGVSLCGLTAAQALFGRLGLDAPWDVSSFEEDIDCCSGVDGRDGKENQGKKMKLLLYGASTSVALYAAQLIHHSAKASKREIEIYGIASASHHDVLKQEPYNYTALADYTSPTWPEEISYLAETAAFDLAFDCISEGDSVIKVSSLLSTTSKLAVVRSREGGAFVYDEARFPAEPLYGAVWTGLGERVEYQGMVLERDEKEREFAVQFYKWLSGSGDEGEGGEEGVRETRLMGNVVRSMPGGLKRVVEDGFVLLGGGGMGDRTNKREEEWMRAVRREKLVYKIG
jgi:NADPH:quinone reductase-like Zn-dependent oxidoreductase